jgi:cytochrome c5
MKHDLAARLLTAISLTTMLSVAIANQELLPEEPSNEVILPDQSAPRPEAEVKPALPVIGSRGQMLYENHCQGCHTSVVHVREMRRVRSMNDLEHWVKRWAGTLKLPWSADEIQDVIDYLDQRYYKLK